MMKIRGVGKMVKDVWLMLGITILLFCFLEGSLTLAFFIKDRFSAPDHATTISRDMADTYSDSSWVKNYYEEFQRSFGGQWKPYVYWQRKPYHGNYINIDSSGIRLTTLPNSLQQEFSTPMKIFMFGGSTLWGTGARDAFTIPSIFAKELQKEGMTSEVINFGESGYVSTQEVIALLLQLQKGQIPDFVIFYDGVNDMYSAYQQGVAGLPQNEFNRVDDFNLCQPAKLKQRTGMVLRDVAKALSTIRFTKGLLRKLGIWREAGVSANSISQGVKALQRDIIAREVLATYKGNFEIVKALSEHYHFKYIHYLQPTVFQKVHLTEYEQVQQAKMQTIKQFARCTYGAIRRSRFAEMNEDSFHDISLLFANVQEPVYVDWCHIGESGNERIAKRIVSDVHRLLIANK